MEDGSVISSCCNTTREVKYMYAGMIRPIPTTMPMITFEIGDIFLKRGNMTIKDYLHANILQLQTLPMCLQSTGKVRPFCVDVSFGFARYRTFATNPEFRVFRRNGNSLQGGQHRAPWVAILRNSRKTSGSIV